MISRSYPWVYQEGAKNARATDYASRGNQSIIFYNEKKVTMEEMKFYSEEEMLDKHVGKIGTPHRDQFEDEINTFLIGEAIKEARKNKKLTQEQLGNLIGVKKGQISKIENGKNLTLNTISRVLHAMGLQAHLNIPTVGQYAI